METEHKHKCEWAWGSHGCGLPCHADGNHQCLDPDGGDVCHEVSAAGVDASGFQWRLYGGESPWPTHPIWTRTDYPCPRCAAPTTLVAYHNGVTHRCCAASSCGCIRGHCPWVSDACQDPTCVSLPTLGTCIVPSPRPHPASPRVGSWVYPQPVDKS